MCLKVKHYFQKKNSRYVILNNLYFASNFVFWGVSSRAFYSVLLFKFFVVHQPWWPTFLLNPHHKNAFYGPAHESQSFEGNFKKVRFPSNWLTIPLKIFWIKSFCILLSQWLLRKKNSLLPYYILVIYLLL